jgi:hypothetical protein
MNSFIASQIKEIASELILDALENGDALQTAKGLRAEIKAGWLAALESTNMPQDMIAKLAFPL